MPELREALEAAVNEAETHAPETSVAENPAPSHSEGADNVESLSSVESPETEASAGEAVSSVESPDTKAPADEVAPDKQPKEAEGQDKRGHRVDRAPQSWKADAKGEWAALPLRVRQEIHRREADINKVLAESHDVRQIATEFANTIAPYAARIKSYNLGPMQAVEELLKADYILGTGSKEQRAEYLATLIGNYSVDLEALDAALVRRMGGQGRQVQPQDDIEQRVLSRVQQLVGPLLQQQQQQRTVEQQRHYQMQHEADMTVEQMGLDPNFPHFEEVRQDMADLIEMQAKRGVYLSLNDAYSKAVMMNNGLSQAFLATSQNQRAQKAKQGNLSISGAPAMGGSPSIGGNGDLRSTIEAAFNGARI